VVKIEKIVGRIVVVSGLDMCHGTPVLDIKPYIHLDAIPHYVVPPWVTCEDVPKWEMVVRPEAQQSLKEILEDKRPPLRQNPKLLFYDGYDGFMALLKDVLLLDVRSVHQGRGQAESHSIYCCNLDGIAVEFITREGVLEVLSAIEQEKEWSWDGPEANGGEQSIPSTERREDQDSEWHGEGLLHCESL